MSRMQRYQWVRRIAQLTQRDREPAVAKGVTRWLRRPRFEPLEGRYLLAVFTVGNLNDAGADSLREAILSANATVEADTIDLSAVSGSIHLTTGEMLITEALTITGPGETQLTVDAQQNSRIFNIAATTGDFSLSGLTLTGGRTSGDNLDEFDSTYSGGAIRAGTTGLLSLTGVTIAGNSTAGFAADGGGVFASGQVTLVDSTISGNTVEGRNASGGGVYSADSVALNNTSVLGNRLTGDCAYYYSGYCILNEGEDEYGGVADGGAGIHAEGAVDLIDSLVDANVTSGDSQDGGGIFARGAVSLTDSQVNNNITEGRGADGGGIFSTGNVTLLDSTVSGNTVEGNDAGGGGIYSIGNDLAVQLTSSSVSDNRVLGYQTTYGSPYGEDDDYGGTSDGGGGIHTTGSVELFESSVNNNATYGVTGNGGGILAGRHVTITSSTVAGNSTLGIEADGGGIFAGQELTLINSTISDNSTAGELAQGGGIFAFGGVTLTHSTVTDNHVNHALALGGGIWNDNGPMVIINSILAANTAGAGSPDLRPGTGALTVKSSLVGDNGGTVLVEANPDVEGNIIGGPVGGTINPLLGPLADNGGPTQTRALLAGSPAIDAGDTALTVAASLVFDQRGLLRAVDGDSNVSIIVDMGAFEFGATAVPVPATLLVDISSDEFNFDFSPLNFSLREAIGLANARVGADTIMFDTTGVFATPQTITLVLGGMLITEALTITGPGETQLTIDAQQNSRIFNIAATTGDFSLSGLTLTGGRTSGDNLATFDSTYSGGAIRAATTGLLSLTGVTIAGNSTAGFAADGGGIFASGQVTLVDSTISGNTVEGRNASGGGVYSADSVALNNTSVLSNRLTGDCANYYSGSCILNEGEDEYGGVADGGAGIHAEGAVDLIDSFVDANVTSGDSQDGGGIFARGAVSLTDSQVNNNITEGRGADGGGIFSTGNVTLLDSTVSGNTVEGNDAGGGGIYSIRNGLAVRLTSSSVSDNRVLGYQTYYNSPNGEEDDYGGTSDGGGGIHTNGSVELVESSVNNNATYGVTGNGGGILAGRRVTITSSTVAGNSTLGVEADGGGIFAGERLTLLNSTVSGNSTAGNYAAGGGIYASQGEVTLTSSTVSGNSTTGNYAAGGGIFFDSGVSFTIENSIVAGNTDNGTAPDLRPDPGSTLTINHSLIGDTTGSGITIATGTGNILNQPALLGPLQGNGGPTQTHALLPGSPALDAGSSPISLFRFEGDATDSIGTNNGTLQGGLLADDPGAPNISPTGVQFADIGTQFITLASPLTIGSTSSTIEAWVNIPIGADKFRALLSNFNSTPGSIFWGIDTSGVPRINWNNSEVILNGTTDLRDGQWHHLTYVRDVVVNEFHIYVDGIEDATSTSAGSDVTLTTTHRIGNSQSGLDPFEGTIDELAIFDRTLSPAEIRVRAGIFDQRGDGFARVANGGNGQRQDIGAYEAQVAPSADFVDDDVITGLDFLAWQRGFGTTTGAVRTDGNSDDDGDVDASDLAAWEATYGQVETTPLVAGVSVPLVELFAASDQSSAVDTQRVAPSIATPTDLATAAQLIDAALALAWMGAQTPADEVVAVDTLAAADAFYHSAYVADDSPLAATGSAEFEWSASGLTKDEDMGDPWLAGELLERVFG